MRACKSEYPSQFGPITLDANGKGVEHAEKAEAVPFRQPTAAFRHEKHVGNLKRPDRRDKPLARLQCLKDGIRIGPRRGSRRLKHGNRRVTPRCGWRTKVSNPGSLSGIGTENIRTNSTRSGSRT